MDKMIEKNTKVDCAIIDPPYNIGGTSKQQIRWNSKKLKTVNEVWDTFSKDEFFSFNYNWLLKCKDIIKENGNIIVFGSMHNIYQIGFLLQLLEYKINNHITYFKRNAPPNISCRTLTHSCEYAIWAVNGDKNWTFNYQLAKQLNDNKQQRDLYTMDYTDFIEYIMTPQNEKTEGKHKTQKPLRVINDMVRLYSEENIIIFDPFAGSGTTAVAAKMNNRQFICCDKEKENVEIALNRLKKIA